MVDHGVTTWLAEDRVGDRVVLRIGRRGDALVAQFGNWGLLTTRKGGQSYFQPASGISSLAVEKVRASLVDAFVRHAQGKLTLHGGAVCKGNRAVALLGPSRAGKSTLTAALCADPAIGMIGDDTVAIELPDAARGSICVVPTQKTIWLLPDACQALGLEATSPRKTAVLKGAEGSQEKALIAVVAMAFDETATTHCLRRLRGQDAFSILCNSAFRLIIDDPTALLREFQQLHAIVEGCRVYELSRPRDLGKLTTSVSLVRDLLDGEV